MKWTTSFSLGKVLLLSICLIHGTRAYAQKNFTDNLNAMIQVHAGYNLPEYPFIYSITEDYIRSVDVCLFKESVGKNIWDQLYNYPEYGVSLFYSSLGNDEIFGREFALNLFFKNYFFSGDRFRLFTRFGIGISHVNRKFDLLDNYLNVAIASHMNMHFNARIGANYAISEKFKLNTGISFDHLSNANVSEPNLGINYLTAYGGVSYRIGEKSEKQVYEIIPHVRKNEISLYASIGGKHSRALSSNYFLTSSVSIEVNRSITRKFHFGIGGDIFYDSSVESSLEKEGMKYKNSDSFQTGIHLTLSLRYNKLTFSIQGGIYLGLTEQVDQYKMYNRALMQYQIAEHLLIRICMKSHLHILDYPEIGFGYKF